MVSPGFQDGDDRPAIGVSVCSIGIPRNYTHLGDRIGRGIVRDKIVLWFVVVGAFNGVVVLLSAIAVDLHLTIVKSVALDGIVTPQSRWIGIDGAGNEQGQRGKIAPIQRDIGDLVGRESVSE